MVRLAIRCRTEALAREGSPDLIKHGDWCFDRALFARRFMRERGAPLLIERVIRDLLSAFDAYRHAIYGVFLPADNELPRLLGRMNEHRTAAKSGRKITK